jgi:hypothetical protein
MEGFLWQVISGEPCFGYWTIFIIELLYETHPKSIEIFGLAVVVVVWCCS